MKKIATLISLVTLIALTSCGSKVEVESEVDQTLGLETEVQEMDTDIPEELSEEDLSELFDEIMRQVEGELSIDTMITDSEAFDGLEETSDDSLFINESGELNPGIVGE